jgi:hypothetical protein
MIQVDNAYRAIPIWRRILFQRVKQKVLANSAAQKEKVILDVLKKNQERALL